MWAYDVQWDWRQPPEGTAASFVSAAAEQPTPSSSAPGSADLWIRSDADDTDLEVTISEIRPDGQEVYVQSGWLRASQRALDEAASTELRPCTPTSRPTPNRSPPASGTRCASSCSRSPTPSGPARSCG